MSSYQKVIVCGNLGQDPEVRHAQNGNAIANISVATSRKWKDQNTGEMQEQTEWHRITLFNKLGEIAGQYLKKGDKVLIDGRLETRKYQDSNGVDKWSTSIIADQMQMLSPKGENSGGRQGGQQYAPQGGAQPAQAAPKPEPSPDFDDDIPF